jgi:NADH:ubiquinone reductase (H+-translocating)
MEAARIIIVGGGFAGANLAGHLNRRVARDVEVVVISSENHKVFTPMLAEEAGRSLSGLDVVMPGRQMAPRADPHERSLAHADGRDFGNL